MGGRDLGLRLRDGRVHEYKTAEPATVRTTRFALNTIRVKDIENAFKQSFGSVQRGDREMTTCEMMDRVAASRQTLGSAAVHRRAVAENDVRALLHLWGVAEPSVRPATIPPRCGAWRGFERRMARLLLPKPAAAQVVAADTVARLGQPYGAAFSTLSDATIARENEEFARRDVNQFSVEIHKKYTLSAACLSFVLIGIALALRFRALLRGAHRGRAARRPGCHLRSPGDVAAQPDRVRDGDSGPGPGEPRVRFHSRG